MVGAGPPPTRSRPPLGWAGPGPSLGEAQALSESSAWELEQDQEQEQEQEREQSEVSKNGRKQALAAAGKAQAATLSALNSTLLCCMAKRK